MRHSGAFAAAILLVICAAFGQEKKPAAKPEQKPPMDQKDMMEMMQKLATPSEGHKKLDVLVGSWQAKGNMWMEPGKPPAVTEGKSEQKWVLGGRFLEQRVESTFMGMPFSGLGYTGYDNYKKRYVGTWMDTAGTMIMNTTGSFDHAGKVMTATSRIDDFTTGKVATVRLKTTLVSKDEVLFEMFGPGADGKDYRMMELRYTRKK